MCKSLKNEKGGMLVYTLLIFLIFTILGVSLMAYTYSDVKLSQVDQKQQGAFYIAEAGANEAFHRIKEEIYWRHEAAPNKEVFFSTLEAYIESDWKNEIIDDFEEQLGANPTARVEVEQIGTDPYTFEIKSTGIIEAQERVVTKPFTVHYRSGSSSFLDLPDGVAGIFRDRAELVGSGSIDKDMYLLSEAASTIDMNNGGRVDGTIYVPENAVHHAFSNGTLPNIGQLPENGFDLDWFDQQLVNIIHNFPEPSSASPPESDPVLHPGAWELTKNTFLDELDLDGKTLNIDTKGHTVDLVVNNLIMGNDGALSINADGKLNLYVLQNIQFGGGSKANINGSFDKLNIYYSGSGKLSLDNAQALNGTIFVKSAEIEFTGGSEYKGYIISGGSKVTLLNGAYSERLILAPLANIEMMGGASMEGVVIGKTLNSRDNASINYKKIDTSLLPPIESVEDDGGGEIIETGATIEIE